MSDRPETPPDTNDFDIFLAHGNGDKPQVLVLHRRLEAHGFTVFLDNKEIEPGEAWINRLGLALRACRSFLICLGSEGLGRWAECEVEVALSRATQDPSFRVIPVILPGGSQASFEPLSPFLKNHHAVDLSDQANFDTRFDRLCKQIYEACEGRPLQRNHRPLPIGDIARNVEILQSRFSDSIAPYLAGGRLIARKETQQLLEGIEDPDRRLFVVHGSAGSGKSGLLLELAHELETSKTVYLPLRLDEIELEGNPERFARGRLSFPASVGTCLEALAEEADPVLLIDQLDSLRWTGSHSAEAWHLCREMIAEALSWPRIKVVVCCRTFDLETDPQLRAWENEAKQLSRVEVGLLDLDDVTIAVCHLTGSPQATDLDLRPPQWELLRHVHHLQMWMSIYQR
ncbi:MAG: toll/interleukin-1 receptor domain-containing protein [Acidobacteriota bacterium]